MKYIKKILIIDDEPEINFLAALSLKKKDTRCIPVSMVMMASLQLKI